MLKSIGRRLDTIGGGTLNLGGESLIDEKKDTNICPPFSEWLLEGNATVDADGVLTLHQTGAVAWSPLMKINLAPLWRFSTEVYCDNLTPYAVWQPEGVSSRLYSSNHYAADGVTSAKNSSGYASNGNASRIPRSKWTDRYNEGGAWGNTGGGEVIFVKINLSANAQWVTAPIKYRLPMFTFGTSYTIADYTHYYKKGL